MKKIVFSFAFAILSLVAVQAQTLKPGDKAPNFSLKNVDGKTVSLSDYKKEKGVIVIFSCNTCPYVVAYEDRMIELHRKFSKLGYPVIAINPNNPEVSKGDSFEAMQVRAKEKAFPFAYLFDEKQEIFPKYGATRTPEVFLLKKVKKEFVVAYTGTIDDNYKDKNEVKEKYLENAVNAVKEGKTPVPATTKAIGCGIKVKK